MKLLVSGASPISAEVFNFLRICFGCNVLEGYGMTGDLLGASYVG